MHHIFTFFFRLFLAFLAAKFLARFFDLPGLGALVGLTLLFLGNIYLFDYLDYRSHTSWRRRAARPPVTASPVPSATPEQTPEA
jgi:hypothetical protein